MNQPKIGAHAMCWKSAGKARGPVTFEDRLAAATDRIEHLRTLVDTLTFSKAPMRTLREPHVVPFGVDRDEAARVNAALLDQLPGRAVVQGEDAMLLAFAARGRDLDVIVEAEPDDFGAFKDLAVGLDGVFVGAEMSVVDGRPIRRARFAARKGASPGAQLTSVHLRLDAPGRVRLLALDLVAAA